MAFARKFQSKDRLEDRLYRLDDNERQHFIQQVLATNDGYEKLTSAADHLSALRDTSYSALQMSGITLKAFRQTIQAKNISVASISEKISEAEEVINTAGKKLDRLLHVINTIQDALNIYLQKNLHDLTHETPSVNRLSKSI